MNLITGLETNCIFNGVERTGYYLRKAFEYCEGVSRGRVNRSVWVEIGEVSLQSREVGDSGISVSGKSAGFCISGEVMIYLAQFLDFKSRLNLFSAKRAYRELVDFWKEDCRVLISVSEYNYPNKEKVKFAEKYDLRFKLTNSASERLHPRLVGGKSRNPDKNRIKERIEIIDFQNKILLERSCVSLLVGLPELTSVHYEVLDSNYRGLHLIGMNPKLETITIDQNFSSQNEFFLKEGLLKLKNVTVKNIVDAYLRVSFLCAQFDMSTEKGIGNRGTNISWRVIKSIC